jgi:hypothetical protein
MALTTATSTFSTSKYEEWYINEFIQFVRNAKTEEDAVYNIKAILKTYKKRIRFRELVNLMLER